MATVTEVAVAAVAVVLLLEAAGGRDDDDEEEEEEDDDDGRVEEVKNDAAVTPRPLPAPARCCGCG